MSSRLKNEVSVSDFEEEAYNVDTRSKTRHVRVVNAIRISLNVLAFATGLVVLTMAADAKATFNNTSVPPNYLVSLWPYDFNIRPTDALIGTGAIVLLMTCFSFIVSLAPALKTSSIRHGLLNVFAAVSALIGALVGMSYYYIVKASDEVDTIESWSCHWSNVAMKTGPRFGVLCKQTKATIALAIFLVPLEVLIIMCTAYQVIVEQAINYRVKNSRGGAPRMN